MNKKLYLSFPSKTFLIGEYAVLNSAPAVLVNTAPLFQFVITSKTEQSQRWLQNYEQPLKEFVKTTQLNPINSSVIETSDVKNNVSFYKNIHPLSPAGQWLKCHPQIEQHWHIESIDPHKGQGGFGYSSAQFNLMYLLTQINDNKDLKDIHKLWQSYQSLNFDGHTPSGADVVSQWMGQVCLFSSTPFKAQSILWPFKDLDFLIVRTGLQLQTWEHLKNVPVKELSDLSELSRQATDCVSSQDTKGFVSSVEKYGFSLEKQNLVHKNTLILLNKIKKLKNVLTAKGCGAMGAEVIALFFHPQHKEQIKSDLKDLFKDQSIIADSSAVTSGLQIQHI